MSALCICKEGVKGKQIFLLSGATRELGDDQAVSSGGGGGALQTERETSYSSIATDFSGAPKKGNLVGFKLRFGMTGYHHPSIHPSIGIILSDGSGKVVIHVSFFEVPKESFIRRPEKTTTKSSVVGCVHAQLRKLG